MPSTLTGTPDLLRLALRRDRWVLPLWVGGLVLLVATSAAATVGLYPDANTRIVAASAVNEAPSLVAVYGRIYDPSSLGALATFKLNAMGTAIVAALFVWLVIRHTRTDEEAGRLELVGSGRLGRAAPLAAALLLAVGTAVLLGVLTALGLMAGGMPAVGSWAFGLMWAGTGVAFAALAGVIAQLTTSHRAALAIGFGAIAGSYLVRALADLPADGPTLWVWFSPLGWASQVRAFAGDRWWVLLLPILLAVVMVPLAFSARARRDLGAGLWSRDRRGREVGRLHSVAGLAWRLEWPVLLAWLIGFVLFGALMGSIAGTISDWLTSPQAQQLFERLGGAGMKSLTDSVFAMYIAFLGFLAAGYGIAATNRMRGEETAGHAETVLARPVGRVRWAMTWYAAALAGVAVLVAVGGVTMAAGTAASLHDSTQFGRILLAALVQIPAAWVVAALTLVLFGWLPRATAAAWALFLGFLVLAEFGVLLHAPLWLLDLSPFQHTPMLPITAGAWAPTLWLLVIGAGLSVVGLVGWRRRDLTS